MKSLSIKQLGSFSLGKIYYNFFHSFSLQIKKSLKGLIKKQGKDFSVTVTENFQCLDDDHAVKNGVHSILAKITLYISGSKTQRAIAIHFGGSNLENKVTIYFYSNSQIKHEYKILITDFFSQKSIEQYKKWMLDETINKNWFTYHFEDCNRRGRKN